MSWQVTIHLYDLSGGLAKQMSGAFLGKQIDGIWHTGIVVYGKEYYYGGGICSDVPGKTPYGTPIKSIPMGETEIPEEIFLEFLKEVSPKFSIDKYDLFENNCNNFTDACCEFLTGQKIPDFITGLPKEVLATPFGKMIKPMIDGFQKNINANSHPMNLPQMFEGNSNPNALNFNTNTNPTTTTTAKPGEPVVKSVSNIEEFFGLIDDSEGLIVDFFSYTCPPCMQIKPYFEALAKEFRARCPSLKFVSVNTQEAREIAVQFKIQAIPTFIGFYKGGQVERFQGANRNKLESLAYTIESKIFGSDKKASTSTSSMSATDELKLFNPNKKDYYYFKGDNYSLPIGNIKGVLEKFPNLNQEDTKAIFTKFAQDPAANVKSFSAEDKGYLINWIFETMFFIELSDKTIGFLDLLRMLTLDPTWAEIIISNSDRIDQIVSFFDKKDEQLNEIQRGLKLVLLRLFCNITACEKGNEYLKKNLTTIVKRWLKLASVYGSDKASMTAILMTFWNLTQNLSSLKEFDEVRNDIAFFARDTFDSIDDNDNMIPCVMTLAWICYYNKETRKLIEGKINKPKLAKLEFCENEVLSKLSRDLSYILEGKVN